MAAGRSETDERPLDLAGKAHHLGDVFPLEPPPDVDAREEASVAARDAAERAAVEDVVARQRDCGLTLLSDGGFAAHGRDPPVAGLASDGEAWRLDDAPTKRPPLCRALQTACAAARGEAVRATVDHAAALLDLAVGAASLDDPQGVFADGDARAAAFAGLLGAGAAEAALGGAAAVHLDLSADRFWARWEAAESAFAAVPEPDYGPPLTRSVGLRAAPDDLDRFADALQRLDAQALWAPRAALADDVLDALTAWPSPKPIGLGLLDASTRLLDPIDPILRRLEAISERLDLDRCFLTHDDGFHPRGFGAVDGLRFSDQWRKLDHLVAIARRVWAD